MKKFFALLVIFATSQAHSEAPIDLEVFYRHAEFNSILISPGGEYLAARVGAEDRTNIVILDIRNFPDLSLATAYGMPPDEHADSLFWVSDDRLIFSTARQEGALAQPRPTGRIYATNADGSRQLQIFGPRPGSSMVWRSANVIHLLPDDPSRILVAEWAHDRPRPHAVLVNLFQYQRTSVVAVSPLERGILMADLDGQVRFAAGTDLDGEQMFAWRPDADAEWRRFENPFAGDILPLGASRDGKSFFVSSRDRDSLGVYRIEPDSGKITPVLTDENVEVIRPIFDSAGEELIGAVFNTGIPEARFIDPDHETARVWRSLQAALPGYGLWISGFSRDGQRAGVNIFSDREPGMFMLLNVEDFHLQELAASRSWVDPERMARVHPIQLEARDGLPLHGLLTLPPGVDEPRDLPLIVEVHGGPHGVYDAWGWQPNTQAMASRGYAVLQVNFRGSGGYGHQFEYDAYGQWGAEMQDDVTDATLWAIEQGIADPERICISGGSYGGYSAMMGVIREPDLYRCAFAFVGVYDLELIKRTGDIPRSEMGRRYLDRALGTDRAVLRERSPVHHVDRIKADLFIAHGAEDIRAHFRHYHELVAALEKAGIPHETMFVQGEGHGFYQLDNRIALAERMLAFFDRNIGDGRN